MTDPTGRSFLSYRRSRLAEAKLVVAAQRERGIPTWHDLHNLDEGHTEDQLRAILSDRLTANGVMWLTPDVADSPVIRRIEAPAMLRRLEEQDDFFVIPVAAGGLDYGDAAATVDEILGIQDLSNWNLRKVKGNPIGPLEAAQTADYVLRRRMAAVHRFLAADEALALGLYTRTPAPFPSGDALALDWSHRFNSREADPTTWETSLLPALHSVADAIQTLAPGRRVVAHGMPSIPAALALGTAFLAPKGLKLAWRQYTPGQADQEWSVSNSREQSSFSAQFQGDKVDADDLAVLVSVAEDVRDAFRASRPYLPRFRGILQVSKAGAPPHVIKTPGEAIDLAHVTVEGMRNARREFGHLRSIHLFMAVPIGLAMLVGQLLNTFGLVQTYEHVPVDAIGRYHPAALLKPAA